MVSVSFIHPILKLWRYRSPVDGSIPRCGVIGPISVSKGLKFAVYLARFYGGGNPDLSERGTHILLYTPSFVFGICSHKNGEYLGEFMSMVHAAADRMVSEHVIDEDVCRASLESFIYETSVAIASICAVSEPNEYSTTGGGFRPEIGWRESEVSFRIHKPADVGDEDPQMRYDGKEGDFFRRAFIFFDAACAIYTDTLKGLSKYDEYAYCEPLCPYLIKPHCLAQSDAIEMARSYRMILESWCGKPKDKQARVIKPACASKGKRTTSVRELLWNSYPHVCGLCGGQIEAIDDMHIDHIIPLSKGGKDVLANLQLTHANCNLAKGDKEQSALDNECCM